MEILFAIRSKLDLVYGSKNKSTDGLLINNKPLKLKGVNLHHDGGCLSAAAPAWAWKRRLLQIKISEVVMLSELLIIYQLRIYWIYVMKCDLLVIDEAFDKWRSGSYERYS